MVPNIDPKVDYAFKRLFGVDQNKDLLLSFLNAVLDPPAGAELTEVVILNPFNEKDFEGDKLSVLDLKVQDQSGRLFNIEMQLVLPRAMASRVLYYWAELYRRQMAKSDQYDQLRPAISIYVVNGVMFPEAPGYHLVFDLRERRSGVLFSENMQVHVVELGKFGMASDDLAAALDRWAYFLKHGETLDDHDLPASLDEPPFRKAMEQLMGLSLEEIAREPYYARQKMLRDVASERAYQEEADRNVAEAKRIRANIERMKADIKRTEANIERMEADIKRTEANTKLMIAEADAKSKEAEARSREADAKSKEADAATRRSLLRQISLLQQLLNTQAPTPSELDALPNDQLEALTIDLQSRWEQSQSQ